MANPKDSLMDNPDVAKEPEPAIDYAHAAGEMDGDLPVAGPGDMPVERQKLTFEGFMSISRYAGAAIVLLVFWSTILFALHGGPILTALSTLGLGLLLAAALKLRGAYFPVLIISCLVLGGVSLVAGGGPDIPSPDDVEVTN